MKKRLMKKCFMLLVVVALMSFWTMSVLAAPVTDNAGDTVTWSFDPETNELVLDGTGYMTDYASAEDVPWNAYQEQSDMLPHLPFQA